MSQASLHIGIMKNAGSPFVKFRMKDAQGRDAAGIAQKRGNLKMNIV